MFEERSMIAKTQHRGQDLEYKHYKNTSRARFRD